MYLCEIERFGASRGTVRIYAIGDLHADRVEFDEGRLTRWVQLIAKDKDAVAIFVGDALDGRVPGMKHFDADTVRRDYLGNLKSYVNYGVEIVANYLRPIPKAGVPLVVVSGNHDEYLEGVGLSALLCKEIGGKNVHYLGGEGFIRVQSGRPQAHYTTVIYATHGTGGGKTPGPKVNAMQRYLEWVDADVVMAGHVHDGSIRVIHSHGITTKGQLAIVKRPRVLYRATSFVQRSIAGVVGYQGKKGYPATDEGLQWVSIDPQEHRAVRYEADF